MSLMEPLVVYHFKKTAFSFIYLFYFFLSLFYFFSDLYDFLPSTNFELLLFFLYLI